MFIERFMYVIYLYYQRSRGPLFEILSRSWQVRKVESHVDLYNLKDESCQRNVWPDASVPFFEDVHLRFNSSHDELGFLHILHSVVWTGVHTICHVETNAFPCVSPSLILLDDISGSQETPVESVHPVEEAGNNQSSSVAHKVGIGILLSSDALL